MYIDSSFISSYPDTYVVSGTCLCICICTQDRILVVGATNRPQELDEAARRRFVKRLYIPLPEPEARRALVTLLLKKNSHELTESDIDAVVEKTAGFSGADIRSLCTEGKWVYVRVG